MHDAVGRLKRKSAIEPSRSVRPQNLHHIQSSYASSRDPNRTRRDCRDKQRGEGRKPHFRRDGAINQGLRESSGRHCAENARKQRAATGISPCQSMVFRRLPGVVPSAPRTPISEGGKENQRSAINLRTEKRFVQPLIHRLHVEQRDVGVHRFHSIAN